MERQSQSAPIPPISNRLTDVEIPKLWSSWEPFGAKRGLRRELTASERGLLAARRDELAPFVEPFPDREKDRVMVAISDLFSAFRSMRQVGDEAVAIVDGVTQSLRKYPLWAIEKACASIRENGIWRDGAFDRRWPPNDAELIAEVRKSVQLYESQHRSAVAMLDAEVER